MRAESTTRSSGPRWGWLLTTLALGLGLAGASWANYRSARDSVAAIELGQARLFEGVIANAIRRTDLTDPTLNLDSLVEAHADAGLRFVGAFSTDAGLIGLGGTSESDAGRMPGRGPRLERVGGRIRSFLPWPPRGPREQTTPDARLTVVVEFEPLVAGQLMRRALRSMMVGGMASGVLMLTAVLFWRATIRREAVERTMQEQRRLSTLGELSAVLAHEIRNPLASLKGHAQLLAEDTPGDAPARRRVDRIVTEVHRLEALSSDLLDFVRTGPLELEPIHLDEMLRRAILDRAVTDVELDCSGAPETWPMDARRIEQVLMNLLDNAVAASPAGAPIRVMAWEQRGSLVITVSDKGPGIPEQNLDQIFEPFFTTGPRGTGLGLAVARRIVELHGGTMSARSLPEGGAEIRLSIAALEA
jgi:two-component system sensor histidine kinase HydH